jgi:hypothetical protein
VPAAAGAAAGAQLAMPPAVGQVRPVPAAVPAAAVSHGDVTMTDASPAGQQQ